ncbi:DNA helicase PSH3, putative [Plasmodium chabaudi chabaudi]|uniref:DNA helicase PSH3, putative n=1 Tax=Plasmodium chabaudi chabaudi TaxID=31271 RepID=A0A4V0KAI0_PLACU|nr:DNA helicase PSH3, putative [Plasmodium chabaudi chabaudi]VTZ69713.1 DNA helicase PSH3, putative [Plasmodium chabaudi chabaudi]|eukprot:XP_743882.2 RNA helicase, putative [Plasmodium chabaudi chabaudi]
MNKPKLSLSDLNKLLVDPEKDENGKEKEFQELSVPEEVIDSLKKLNIIYPSQIQCITIKEAIHKQNLIIQSKNGTGKSTSICIILISHILKKLHKNMSKEIFENFLNDNKEENHNKNKQNGDPINTNDNYCENIFLFSLFFYGVVLVPTRELCVQIYDTIHKISENLIIKKNKKLDSLSNIGEPNVVDKHVDNNSTLKIKSIILYGGTDVYENIKELFLKYPQIIISTPGRLKHVLRIFQSATIELDNIHLFQKSSSSKIKIFYLKIINLLLKKLVIDEVDALLDEQFEEQMKIIFTLLINPKVQILAYSSTFNEFTIETFKRMVASIDISYVDKAKNLYSQIGTITTNPVLANDELNQNESIQKSCAAFCHPTDKNVETDYSSKQTIHNDNIQQNLDDKIDDDIKEKVVSEDNLLAKKCIKTAINKKKKKKKKKKNINVNVNIKEIEKNILNQENVKYFIIEKMKKEKKKIDIYSSRKREFKICQTCTSIILMQENEIKKSYKLDSPILMNIKHCFITINNENMNKHEELKYKLKVLLKIIKEIKFEQCFLFINNSYEGLQITKMMKKYNIDCYYTSSKVEHNERIQSFYKLKKNKMKIVICTDVMSRGIDNIVCDLVINFDIPYSKEIYIHRSGRCGRYGNKGLCISLCNYTDYNYLYYFKYTLKLEVYDFYYLSSSQNSTKSIITNVSNRIDTQPTSTHPAKQVCNDVDNEMDLSKDKTICNSFPIDNRDTDEWGAFDFYSNSDILKKIIGENYIDKVDQTEESKCREKLFVKINIKGFYSKFVNTLKDFNRKDENVYLKICFKKLLTKLKIIKNEISYFFYFPNDNIHFFKSINIIEHKSNLILYFTFTKKIKIYYTTYLDRLKAMTNIKKKKYCYTNFCMLFFCNSNSYMVLKIYYAFLFFFKYYRYPLKDSLSSMPLMCANAKETHNKKIKKNKADKLMNNGETNFEQFNYSSDSFLLLYDEISKWDKKENQLFSHKSGYNSDQNYDNDDIIYMNKQGKIIDKGASYDIRFFSQFIFSSNKKKKRKYLIEDIEKNINDKEYSSDNIDYNILNKTENVTFNTLLFDDALNNVNISVYEKKQLAYFSYQCDKIQCINNEQKIIANLNRLINTQIFLNLNYNENSNLLKSVFLQNHMQMCNGF